MLGLVISKDKEQELIFPLVQNVVSIGSHRYNDIQLDDPSLSISRFHIALFKDKKGSYHLQDLGSKNGTIVNGKSVLYKILQIGDEISIGKKFLLAFQDVKESKGGKKGKPVRILSEKKDVYQPNVTQFISFSSSHEDDITKLERSPQRLALLYRLTHEFTSAPDVEDMLQDTLKRVIEATGAERGFIARGLTVEGLDLLARVPDEIVTIRSRTFISKVLIEGSPLITRDAVMDTRFKDIGSVSNIGIRSAIGIPLKGSLGVMGLLYLDSRQKSGLFSEDDLTFLSLFSRDITLALSRDEENEFKNIIMGEDEIVGICPQIKELLRTIEKIAVYPASVLITGETGVGKELVAKAIHKASKRKGRFIEFNCAAVPETLIESELFGYRKGSHATAFRDKKGLFELASGGILFLDEIGDMGQTIQAKTLKAIDEKEIWSLGATEFVKVDTRVVSATNKNLMEECRSGKFRRDLYERLKVVEVDVPPLRQRKEDIPLLAGFFIHKFRQKFNTNIGALSRDALELLMEYSWPGNIRELKNVIEGAAIYAGKSSVITAKLLKKRLNCSHAILKSLEDVEKEYILEVLEHTGGNKEKALKILGISRQTLYNKGIKYDLPGFEKEE